MALQLKWSPSAVAHLESICDYIALDSPYYASVFAKKVMNLVKLLTRFPKMGRVVPEYNNENLREKIYGNYRIVYRLKKNMVEIAAICHGSRLLEKIL